MGEVRTGGIKKPKLEMIKPQIFDKSFYNNFQVLLVDFKEKRPKKKPRIIPCKVILRRFRDDVPAVEVLLGYELDKTQEKFIAEEICKLLSLYCEKEFLMTVSVMKKHWAVPNEEKEDGKRIDGKKKFVPEYFG